MPLNEQRRLFGEYIRAMGLKTTTQRDLILNAFLTTNKHLSIDEIYRMVNKNSSHTVGYATVHRTMKLITDCGLAREVKFDDGISRFEPLYGRQHHHHLVCTECRQVIEFESPEMDRREKEIVEKYGFEHHFHRFEIFGLCPKCRKRPH